MKKRVSLAAIVAAAFIGPTAPVMADSDPYLGDIMLVGFNFCPRGWQAANGQLLPIAQNQSLFSLLGSNFGGDGRTTFALPDMRGRAPVNVGTVPGGSTYQIAERGGVESVAQTVANLPSHNHGLNGTITARMHGSTNGPSTNDPSGAMFGTFPAGNSIYASAGTPEVDMANNSALLDITASIGLSGGQQNVYNMQPYQVVNYCIATVGAFPPRD